jgi:hypothetical protein
VVCTLGGDFSAGVALPELHLPHHLITSYISTLSYRKASMRHVPDNKLRLSRHHCQSNSEARKSLTSHPAGTLNPMCYKPTCIRSLAHKLDRRVANYTCQKALQCYGGITFHYLLLLFLSSRPGRGPCGERLAYSQVYSQSCLGLSSLLYGGGGVHSLLLSASCFYPSFSRQSPSLLSRLDTTTMLCVSMSNILAFIRSAATYRLLYVGR